jgi:hypothetical protein
MTGNPGPSQSRHIVDVLGGRVRAAEITGYSLTLIDSWLRCEWVHGKYHRHILESAWAAGVKMNQLDFVAHLAGLTPPVVEREPERMAG